MNKFKNKITLMALMLMSLVVLVACGGDKSSQTDTQKETVVENIDESMEKVKKEDEKDTSNKTDKKFKPDGFIKWKLAEGVPAEIEGCNVPKPDVKINTINLTNVDSDEGAKDVKLHWWLEEGEWNKRIYAKLENNSDVAINYFSIKFEWDTDDWGFSYNGSVLPGGESAADFVSLPDKNYEDSDIEIPYFAYVYLDKDGSRKRVQFSDGINELASVRDTKFTPHENLPVTLDKVDFMITDFNGNSCEKENQSSFSVQLNYDGTPNIYAVRIYYKNEETGELGALYLDSPEESVSKGEGKLQDIKNIENLTKTIYTYVPKHIINELIKKNGGIAYIKLFYRNGETISCSIEDCLIEKVK